MNPYEVEFLAKRILEQGMKEELLREDEQPRIDDKFSRDEFISFLQDQVRLLRQRLIEEREKNAKLEKELERLGNVVLGEG